MSTANKNTTIKHSDGTEKEYTPEELKSLRKKLVQETLAADKEMDEVIAEMATKLNEAKEARSIAIAALVETGVEKFKHPDGYVLTPSQKKKTKSGVPGIFFLRGKPQVEKSEEEVFDMDEE